MQSTTIKNEGMVSLNQSLRQRIIYNNSHKKASTVKIDNDPEPDFLDKLNDIMTCVVGYLLILLTCTGIIAIVAAMAH